MVLLAGDGGAKRKHSTNRSRNQPAISEITHAATKLLREFLQATPAAGRGLRVSGVPFITSWLQHASSIADGSSWSFRPLPSET
jgi:hypothetical protein